MKVYIIEAKRSAIASYLGSLKDISPGHLAGYVIEDLTKNIDKKLVDEVIVGNVLSAGHSQGIGRQASKYGGLFDSTIAYTINILCGSGMKSVMNAVFEIKAGNKDLIIAGGVENMSLAPYLLPAKSRIGLGLGDFKLIDSMVNDALTDAFGGFHMGITAENIAQKYNISRKKQDEYAITSQMKAINADDKNKFKDEITPIVIKSKKANIIFDKDEYINRSTSLEKLSNLKAAFKKDGTVTAGNSSGINDGASFTLIASSNIVQKYNLKPLVEISALIQKMQIFYLMNKMNKKEVSKFVKDSMTQVQYMSDTLHDFRNFLKPSRKKEYFEIKKAISEIFEIIGKQIFYLNIEVKFEYAEEKIFIYAYKNEIKQVLLNIVNNAKNKLLKIEDPSNFIGVITIKVFETKDFVNLEIWDNGGEIDLEVQKHVFEPFFTTKSKGTGFGLYMAKVIVEDKMNGKISVSNINQNVVFAIKIPKI